MVSNASLLVLLVTLVDRIPLPPLPARRGRPPVYSDRLFLKALVIMVLTRLPTVHAVLAVLEQPTAEMQHLRLLLHEQGRFPARRTWERRLAAIPSTLPAQIACLGQHLLAVLDPWHDRGRAVAPQTPGPGHRSPFVDRHRGPLDQIRLARLGLRVEAAPDRHRGGRLAPPAGGSHARQRRR